MSKTAKPYIRLDVDNLGLEPFLSVSPYFLPLFLRPKVCFIIRFYNRFPYRFTPRARHVY